MKKLLSFLIVWFSLMASAQTKKVEVDGIWYNITPKSQWAEVTRESSSQYYVGNVTIPEEFEYEGNRYTVIRIGVDTFSYSTDMTSVSIPKSVTTIKEDAFRYCKGLTSITIPSTIETMALTAFTGCSGISRVNYPDDETMYRLAPGHYFTFAYQLFVDDEEIKDLIIPDEVILPNIRFSRCASLTSVVLPNSAETVPQSAFQYCTNLSSVTLSENLKTFDYLAFDSCVSLKEIILPNSLTSVGQSSFSNCESLSKIVIPDNVTEISSGAFRNCSRLSSVKIPKSVKTIGYNAFKGCQNLREVHISDLEAWCQIRFDNDNVSFDDESSWTNPLMYAHRLILNGVELEELTIPSSIEAILSGTFAGYSGTIIIPEGMKTIGPYAFYCSENLSVSIPSSLTKIAATSFANSKDLKFFITDLSHWCNKLNMSWDTWHSHSYELYLNGEIATNVVIPDDITEINKNVFSYCKSLVSVNVPNSIKMIKDDAFKGCSQLSTVILGNGIQTIGGRSFNSCRNLKDVYCYAENPPNLPDVQGVYNSKAFAYSDIEYATLHVPQESLSKYRSAWIWGSFGLIVPLTDEETGVTLSETASMSVLCCDGVITIQNVPDGEIIRVYDSVGMMKASAKVENHSAVVNPQMRTGEIAIIKIGEQTMKLVVQ
ncbi:MAG: leucine-rich repeat domain-containing protein [Prevotella sp.]|nr:leucine-rich repeat domain-containing protein [Prevotella sp.]